MVPYPFIFKTLLNLLIITVLFVEASFGARREALQNGAVEVLFEEPLEAAAYEVLKIYPIVRKDLEETFKWRVDFRPSILLLKSSSAFHEMAGTHLIVAFAIPRDDLIVIDYSKTRLHPFTLEATLRHELCHLLLHHYIETRHLPRWLDEGVAQWASDGIAEIILNREESVLETVALSGDYILMKDLSEVFPKDQKSFRLAYEESKSLVEYIIHRFGVEKILKILIYLRDGHDIDTAVLEGLSISFDELENSWHAYLKKRLTWYTYLIHHLYEILFALAAVIMIGGFIRQLRKKRAYENGPEDIP